MCWSETCIILSLWTDALKHSCLKTQGFEIEHILLCVTQCSPVTATFALKSFVIELWSIYWREYYFLVSCWDLASCCFLFVCHKETFWRWRRLAHHMFHPLFPMSQIPFSLSVPLLFHVFPPFCNAFLKQRSRN